MFVGQDGSNGDNLGGIWAASPIGSANQVLGLNANSPFEVNFLLGGVGINKNNATGMLYIVTDGTAETGITIEGSASQTGALLQMLDSSQNVFFTSGDGLASSEVVWNDQQADIDFRVEGDGDANLLHVNAGTDTVGIGTAVAASLLDIDGPVGTAILKTTADITLDNTHSTLLSDNTDVSNTVNLPTVASTFNSTDGIGRIYTIKKLNSSGTTTIDGNGSENIDGATTAVLSVLDSSITIQSDGTEWRIT